MAEDFYKYLKAKHIQDVAKGLDWFTGHILETVKKSECSAAFAILTLAEMIYSELPEDSPDKHEIDTFRMLIKNGQNFGQAIETMKQTSDIMQEIYKTDDK